MRFFIPGIDKPADAEKVLEATAKHIGAPLPKAHDERIYTLGWMRVGEKYYAQVGAPLDTHYGGEVVVAILRDGETFCVCTARNGVVSGQPIVIYPDMLPAFVRFEA
jgi:hypothetical protein